MRIFKALAASTGLRLRGLLHEAAEGSGRRAKPQKPGLGLGARFFFLFFFLGGGGWIFLPHLAYFEKGLRICQPYGFWSGLFGAPVRL